MMAGRKSIYVTRERKRENAHGKPVRNHCHAQRQPFEQAQHAAQLPLEEICHILPVSLIYQMQNDLHQSCVLSQPYYKPANTKHYMLYFEKYVVIPFKIYIYFISIHITAKLLHGVF
jgi:hypothetical protein